MKDIVWYPLMCSQEVSYRLGHTDKNDKNCEVCCQEVYDIAWEALKEMIKLWKNKYTDRMPHDDEIFPAWEYKDIKFPFRNFFEWDFIIKKAHLDIGEFYKKHLNKYPSRDEMNAAFQQCQINPDFKYNYSGTTTEENYKGQYRSESFKFAEIVEIDKCVFCGEPIYIYSQDIFKDAGTIEIGFGYGSRRDNSYGKGYIHDLCSAKLDQVLFKKRLNWGDKNYYTIDIEKSEELKELTHVKFTVPEELLKIRNIEDRSSQIEFDDENWGDGI